MQKRQGKRQGKVKKGGETAGDEDQQFQHKTKTKKPMSMQSCLKIKEAGANKI